jgi:hypothetical protein
MTRFAAKKFRKVKILRLENIKISSRATLPEAKEGTGI